MNTGIFNLALGHALQSQSLEQSAIIERLSQIFQRAESECVVDLEREFLEIFFGLAGQKITSNSSNTLFFPTASYAIDLLSTYIREQNWSVLLLEPCFGHIAAMMLRHGIRVESISETIFNSIDLDITLETINSNVLFICSPNNPTGFVFKRSLLTKIADACQRHQILLVIDCSYRFFLRESWNQYALLIESGVDFVVIEDTGKTWPTLDIKIGLLVTTSGLYTTLRNIQKEVILSVSPFSLALLIEYIKDAQSGGLQALWETIDQNRNVLSTTLEDTFFHPITRSKISAEWIHLTSYSIDASLLIENLNSSGLSLLPGKFFFWRTPTIGERYVRVALIRNPDYFANACEILRKTLLSIR